MNPFHLCYAYIVIGMLMSLLCMLAHCHAHFRGWRRLESMDGPASLVAGVIWPVSVCLLVQECGLVKSKKGTK